MRIIAGKYKGRKLSSFTRRPGLRPMTQRVKKSVFDTLRPHFEAKPRVLDLFSGTGSLSFESLSRGALEAYAVEKSPLSCRMIRKNAAALRVGESLTLICQDAFSFLKRYKKLSPFDIVFAGPPFAKKLGGALVLSLNKSRALSAESLVIMELSLGEPLNMDEIILLEKKTFGDKAIYFFRLKKG